MASINFNVYLLLKIVQIANGEHNVRKYADVVFLHIVTLKMAAARMGA